MTVESISIEIDRKGYLVTARFQTPMKDATVRVDGEDVSSSWKQIGKINYFLENPDDVVNQVRSLLRDDL